MIDHEERRTRLGATDVSVILGVSPWRTPYEVWLEKTDRVEPWQGNAATRLGQRLESSLIDYAEEELGECDRGVIVRCVDCPQIGATLDARVIETGCPIEIKTAGLVGPIKNDRWGEPGTDEIPDYYLVQVHTQLLCTGADLAYVYALIGGRGLVRYEVEADAEINEMILERCGEWWRRHMVNDEQPDVNGVSLQTLARVRRVPESTRVLDWRADEVLFDLHVAKDQLKEAEAAVDKHKALLLSALGDAEVGYLPSGVEISYRNQKRKAYQVSESSYRVLRIKNQI